MQKRAADKAVDAQTGSADQGLALQRQIYDEQKASMAPYAAFGQHALGSLGQLMGFPASASTPQGLLANQVGRDAFGNPLGPITNDRIPLNMSDPRVQHLAQGGSLVDLSNGNGTIGSIIGQSAYGANRDDGEFTGVAKRRPGSFAVV